MRGWIPRVLIVAAIVTAASAAFAGTYYNIENMSGWSSCGACAGIGAKGPVGTFSMSQTSSPSLDGSSAHFYLGGKSYADALWWKELGANSSVANFTYDLYFYVQNPSVGQALEFDVNQSVNGRKYIFGTECDTRYGHVWKVWNTAGHYWVNTNQPCYPAAYHWNHLTIQLQRAGSQTHFISITLNGATRYINKYFSSVSHSGSELNVAFQMDLNSSGQGYSVWSDEMKLVTW